MPFGNAGPIPEKFRPISIRFDVKRAKDLLGYEIAKQDAVGILTRLGMELTPSNDAFDVTLLHSGRT